ncbi:hypothetical protein M405DRAFT_878784 [Rhizopogon salebrosus TDB-379]|nr:hypothetical protein M405DRAFT_878784 [Rhizopogon salebrosus TDB-379]
MMQKYYGHFNLSILLCTRPKPSFVRPDVGEAMDGFFEYLASNNKRFSEKTLEAVLWEVLFHCSKFWHREVKAVDQGQAYLRKKDAIVPNMNICERSDSGFPAQDVVPSSILTGDMHHIQDARARIECSTSRLRSGRLDIPNVIKIWNGRMYDMSSADRTTFFDKILFEIALGKKFQRVGTTANVPAVEKVVANFRNMALTDAKVEIPQLEGESILTSAYHIC